MNLRDLEYLLALAETGHFGKAARLCNVSQPTLSTQLKKLEDELGTTLVERHSRRVWMTPVGTEVTRQARDIVDMVEKMRILARGGGSKGLAGEVRLGAIPTIGPYLLPHFLPHFKTLAPQLKPYLREEKTDTLLALLRGGQLDGAILALPLPGTTDDLVKAPLFDEPFVLAAPTGHPLLKQKTLHERDLKNQTLLLLEDGHCLRDQALQLCRHTGAREDDHFRATSLETLRQMVAAGMGCTLLPVLAVNHQPGIEVRAFTDPQPKRTVGMVWRRGYPAHGGFVAFSEGLRQLSATLPLVL